MVAADREDAALFYRAIDIKNVVAGPTADIDDERPEIFLVLGQDYLGGSERGECHILDFQRQFLHATDRVLNPRSHSMDNVEIGFEPLPKHPDGIEHPLLPIDVIMLDD